MNLTRKTYSTRSEKTVDFIIGFIGWFVLNSALGGVSYLVSNLLIMLPLDVNRALSPVLPYVSLALACIPFLVNVGLIILFAFTRYWIALGALAAFAAVLVVIICLALIWGAVCFALLASYSASMSP
ncbi:MAG: hypothetical protein AAB217_24660 [Chloroflexota bacterium]